jgi:HPt (histidine-containing phosphotransfer) domain-containing protein
MLKLQLNTPASYTRDMTVELTNQVTGEKKSVKPYLDGSVSVPNIDPGQWRVQVKHPNLMFDAYDRPVKVLPDRPTFAPITIPTNIFENVPIRDIPDADLSPVQQHLDDATRVAEGQGNKKEGQPIYADDWNELAHSISAVSKATREMTDLVSPRGHDHPEIADKFDEVQRNLQRMFDAVGSSLAQLQRQIQQLALQRKIEAALDKTVTATPEVRQNIQDTVTELQAAWADSPGVYSALKRRTAQKLQDQITTVLANETPAVRGQSEVKDLDEFTRAMATEQPAASYQEEIQQQQRTTSKSMTGVLFDAMKAGGRMGAK